MGRATQGVTLIATDAGAKLSGLQRVVENDAAADIAAEATPATGDDPASAPDAGQDPAADPTAT